ncbi:MAG: hypothetical protein V3S44_00290 [Alphaproteobacteria bacterium]
MPDGKLFIRGVLRTGGAMAVAALIGASAQAMACAGAGDRDGMAVRALQTRLMVAALTCDARADYNRFVTRFRPHLTEQATRLRRYFRHAHGERHKQALNLYVTDLANQASTLSINDRAGFCATGRAAFDRLLGAPDRDAYGVLSQVAAETGGAHDPKPGC